MYIGVLCEGGHDEIPFKIIISRLLIETFSKKEEDFSFESKTTNGSPTFIDVHSNLSALLTYGCSILILTFDCDGKQKKKKNIQKIILRAMRGRTFPPENMIKILFDSEFEEWLLIDEDNIKKILCIPPDRGLSLDHTLAPKEQLNLLIDKAFRSGKLSVTETKGSIYESICKTLDFSKLSRNSMFRKLSSDLKLVI